MCTPLIFLDDLHTHDSTVETTGKLETQEEESKGETAAAFKSLFEAFRTCMSSRPLVYTFKKYLRADTNTFLQNVSIPIQIQYQKMYLCADTDTIFQKFEAIFRKKCGLVNPVNPF